LEAWLIVLCVCVCLLLLVYTVSSFQAPDAGVAMEWVLSINQASTDLKVPRTHPPTHAHSLLCTPPLNRFVD
jgi:hypothetical protein